MPKINNKFFSLEVLHPLEGKFKQKLFNETNKKKKK